jgi:predicted transcriptional regulator
MPTKVLTAQVPERLARKVDKLATALDRPRSWIVKQALQDWIDRAEDRHRMTLEALADVDAGRMVDHDAVQTWIRSLSTNAPLKPPRP